MVECKWLPLVMILWLLSNKKLFKGLIQVKSAHWLTWMNSMR